MPKFPQIFSTPSPHHPFFGHKNISTNNHVNFCTSHKPYNAGKHCISQHHSQRHSLPPNQRLSMRRSLRLGHCQCHLARPCLCHRGQRLDWLSLALVPCFLGLLCPLVIRPLLSCLSPRPSFASTCCTLGTNFFRRWANRYFSFLFLGQGTAVHCSLPRPNKDVAGRARTGRHRCRSDTSPNSAHPAGGGLSRAGGVSLKAGRGPTKAGQRPAR